MIKLTNTVAISVAYPVFQSGPDGAYRPGLVCKDQWLRENCQVWEERGTIAGMDAKVVYLFESTECEDEDSSAWPWDSAHVSAIIIADEDGEPI